MSSIIPIVTKCCICVPDLKIAVIMITVYGIVTCPPISWAFLRHTYAIRVSSIATVNTTQHEVIDINFRNILSMGLGVNAGHETSCFKPADRTKKEENVLRLKIQIELEDYYLIFIKYLVWIVFTADVAFLISSIVFLYKIFGVMTKRVFNFFYYSAMVSVGVSFFYAILYVIVCSTSGIGFPVLELLFAIFDLIVWIYFIIVIRSYRNTAISVQSQ